MKHKTYSLNLSFDFVAISREGHATVNYYSMQVFGMQQGYGHIQQDRNSDQEDASTDTDASIQCERVELEKERG